MTSGDRVASASSYASRTRSTDFGFRESRWAALHQHLQKIACVLVAACLAPVATRSRRIRPAVSDIFISYATEDLSRVRPLADGLSGRGLSVWWDRQIQAGRAFDEVIAEALASARCVVVVWSRNSVASSWVREEAEEGRKRGVLIPVLIDEVSPPLGFGRIQAARMIEWDGAPGSEAFQKLAADVTAVTDAASARDQAGTIAPKAPEHVAITEPAVAPRVKASTVPRTSVRRRTVQLWLAAACTVALLAIGVYQTLPHGGNTRERLNPPPEASNLLLTAVLTDGGEPLTHGVRYDVYTAERDAEGNRKRVTGSNQSEASARFPLPAGRYFVRAAYGLASANAEVDVTPGDTTQQILNLRAGVLQLAAVLADRGEALSGVAYEVYGAAADLEGNRKRITESHHQSEASARFLLPAGRYFVRAAYGLGSANAEIEVTPAATTQQILNLRAGILQLTAISADRGEPLSGVAYEVYAAARDVEGNRKHITGSNHDSEVSARFLLPAARYFVTAAHSDGNANAETVVTAGGTQALRLRILPVAKR